MRLCAVGVYVVTALLSACSGSLPKPPSGPVPSAAMNEVPYPPPPARVETVPPRAKDGDVWIDGQWDWDGKVWEWLEGSWTPPRTNAYFTPWSTERRSDGRLFFARAAWRTRDGRVLEAGLGRDACPIPPASPAAAQAAK
jgi:hypothetical protein